MVYWALITVQNFRPGSPMEVFRQEQFINKSNLSGKKTDQTKVRIGLLLSLFGVIFQIYLVKTWRRAI